MLAIAFVSANAVVSAGCDELEQMRNLDEIQAVPEHQKLMANELSELLMGGAHPITNGYAPAGVHPGIDFGGTGDGVTTVRSPVDGTIIANTDACGKVAIFDGRNTVILAHMSHRTALSVSASVAIGDVLGKASDVVGGGCVATAPHLHIEVRTGRNTHMADPAANNAGTTINPLTYTYSAFPPVSLNSPGPHSGILDNPVCFSWSPIQGANTYRLQIAASNSFTDETCTHGCTVNSKAPTTTRCVDLAAGAYYWRVRAGNSGQGGHWSEVRAVTKY